MSRSKPAARLQDIAHIEVMAPAVGLPHVVCRGYPSNSEAGHLPLHAVIHAQRPGAFDTEPLRRCVPDRFGDEKLDRGVRREDRADGFGVHVIGMGMTARDRRDEAQARGIHDTSGHADVGRVRSGVLPRQ
jgi:hypothetical protein